MGKIPFRGTAGAMALGITENRRAGWTRAVVLRRTVCSDRSDERKCTTMRCAQMNARVLCATKVVCCNVMSTGLRGQRG
jgi:hypothetical protein